MPDPPFGSSLIDSLLCSESLPESPACGSNTLIKTALSFPGGGASTRILLMDYDETVYGQRALTQKLSDQRIRLHVPSWGKCITTRREFWLRAYQAFLKDDMSLESLQMAIAFVDRFVGRFCGEYAGEIEDAPMECVFEAALVIVEQLLDDGAVQFEGEGDRKKPDNVQLTIKLMLDVTGWEVIDCTAASFVPHFMEHAGVRQYSHCLRQQILAVTTLFMIDERIAENVPQSAMAALAVVFQSWLFMENLHSLNSPIEFAAFGLPHPADFIRQAVNTLLRTGGMTLDYFLKMTDYVMTAIFSTNLHDGLDPLTAWKFCHVMKEVFSSPSAVSQLPQLEQACLDLIVQSPQLGVTISGSPSWSDTEAIAVLI
ncbi:hypothetical protein BV898_11699 [Hypsibius exemplaris]|uniref:Uncharacterized protein n=1 Tax=Hypsibius exemplaris TaxID=2072580 RepID=A0A1W0WFY9_HYPEX|nr:hypothetical protein BV898_11699 [Hypsibius exemplaris]